MTKTKAHRISLRLNEEEYDDLTSGLKPDANLSAFCVPLLRAGARRRRFPGIDFREAGERQVAWLAGTRWPVWMVIDLLDELNGDAAAAAKHLRHARRRDLRPQDDRSDRRSPAPAPVD